jgi:hypothetical protein
LSFHRKFIWIEPRLRGHLSYKTNFSLSQMWPLKYRFHCTYIVGKYFVRKPHPMYYKDLFIYTAMPRQQGKSNGHFGWISQCLLRFAQHKTQGTRRIYTMRYNVHLHIVSKCTDSFITSLYMYFVIYSVYLFCLIRKYGN